MDFKITNIKISVKCRNICLDTVKEFLCVSQIPFSRYNNYLVVKHKYTYIIFKKNIKSCEDIYHVNITKLKNFDFLSEAIHNVKVICVGATISSYTIDNITVSKNFNKKINILHLLANLPPEIKATYNSETFPGVFLKYPKKIGTAILFHTGKCVLLGCKTVNAIESILESLDKVLK
jgi:Transcription factor TFIID (or TATA-binding protein, TBP)